MKGLRFERAPVVASDPNRADIACFVGFVSRRATPLPSRLTRWLKEYGWLKTGSVPSSIEELLDVPVPIDTWDDFDQLFDWERELEDEGRLGTYLGAAIRSYFAQGGRKCYLVRVGDPAVGTLSREDKLRLLIPGYPNGSLPSPVDRSSWSGIAHLYGLPDVSFACMPDLADIVRAEPLTPSKELPQPPAFPERFVACSVPQPAPTGDRLASRLRAPRCDGEGYDDWADAIRFAGKLISRHQREVQLIAAIPLPAKGSDADSQLIRFLEEKDWLSGVLDVNPESLASAFVQLVYPWVRTPGSAGLPEDLESPDAVLAGLLARNALMRRTYRSAANLHLSDVRDIFPQLSRDQMRRRFPDDAGSNLEERVSLLGFTPAGLRLLSDVTTSSSTSYRPAGINRLVSLLVRSARRIGESVAFEPSGERLWGRIRGQLENVLLTFYHAGAFRGVSPAEAFHVRCDRSTMSQNDIDAGRVITQVQFDPAAPVESITVVLAMDEAGRVSLVSPGVEEAA